jgi:hypothetical protein
MVKTIEKFYIKTMSSNVLEKWFQSLKIIKIKIEDVMGLVA